MTDDLISIALIETMDRANQPMAAVFHGLVAPRKARAVHTFGNLTALELSGHHSPVLTSSSCTGKSCRISMSDLNGAWPEDEKEETMDVYSSVPDGYRRLRPGI